MSEYIAKCIEVIGISGNPIKVPGYIDLNSEVVRCRDCINYSGEDSEIYPKWCMQMNITEVEPNGFCAWAERREP